jgi:Domain of unknown function (DUF5047)/Putative phage tail protein
MIKASALLREAARYSQTMSLRVDIYRNGGLLTQGVSVVGGSLTSDRTSKIRLNCTVQLARWPWEVDGIDCRRCQVWLYRGVESLGRREVLPYGRFRIDEVTRSSDGQVSLQCSGLEAYIQDARFISPRTPPYGQSTIGAIGDLIKEIRPTATVRNEATTNRTIRATAPWEKERWDAVEYLGESIGVDVYADARGDFVIHDTPSLATGQPILHLNEGEFGLVVEQKEKDTRDQVYNAAVVTGQSSDPAIPPVFGWSYVSDPQDELFFYGEFGQVPIYYSSQFFTSDAQCQAYSAELLITARAKNTSLTFTTPPTLWYLETGDLVQVDRLDGTSEVHLLQRMSGNLDVSGGLSFDTMSTKVAARLA